jgi:hypothetical protein
MLRKWIGLTLVTLVLFGGGLVRAQESPKKEMQPPVTDSAVTGKAAGEETKPPQKNDVSPPVETRKSTFTCDIHIDNRTPWIIHRVYIDNEYWGSVGRLGDLVVRDVGVGRTKLYAEADFNDGPTRHWGPRWFDCTSWLTFTWTLH